MWCFPGVCSQRCAGGMAVPGMGFEQLTRRHGIKIASTASVEDCSLVIGEIVGHGNILSAARMNNAVVLFLRTTEMANEVVESGVSINGVFTSVLPLSTPSKRVTLSNVPPFIKDEVLLQTLSRHGKVVSQIKKIPIASKSPLLKHVMSFRRFVYMVLKDNKDELDLTLNVKADNFNYVVYATTNFMRCFGCGLTGHLIRACPDKRGNSDDASGQSENVGRPSGDAGEKQAAETGEPCAGETATISPTVGETDDADVPQEQEKNTSDSLNEMASSEGSVVDNAERESADVLQDNNVTLTDNSEVQTAMDVNLMEMDARIFKLPPEKRKRSHVNKSAKKKLVDLSSSDAESESDFSDCSITCSLHQSVYTNRTYSSDDVKTFLKETKHVRNVRIDDYFPDVEQFISKTRSFMHEGCFTEQEVYRLKKMLTKLKVLLSSNDKA